MPQTPKPPGQRVRRNSEAPKWRTLPAEGRAGRAPAMPPRPAGAKPWLKATRDWWDRIWASPMATIWLEADLLLLHVLCDLMEKRNRGTLAATETSNMIQLTDRLGLSARSRRMLQWEVAQAAAAAASPAEPESDEKPKAAPARRKRGHLRAA